MNSLQKCISRDETVSNGSHTDLIAWSPSLRRFRVQSIFIGRLGPVQKTIGHILFYAKIIIEL